MVLLFLQQMWMGNRRTNLRHYWRCLLGLVGSSRTEQTPVTLAWAHRVYYLSARHSTAPTAPQPLFERLTDRACCLCLAEPSVFSLSFRFIKSKDLKTKNERKIVKISTNLLGVERGQGKNTGKNKPESWGL